MAGEGCKQMGTEKEKEGSISKANGRLGDDMFAATNRPVHSLSESSCTEGEMGEPSRSC